MASYDDCCRPRPEAGVDESARKCGRDANPHRACPTFRRTKFPRSLHNSSAALAIDRKSTRLNSSHTVISYAVFCLKKKMRCTCTIHIDGAPVRARPDQLGPDSG